MDSCFYPTKDEWFEELVEEWKNSGKKEFCFPFHKFTPTTLPQDSGARFWMYLYYSQTRTQDESLQRVVKFRVRVVSHANNPFLDPDVYTRPDHGPEPKVWFKCDLVEEIKNLEGGYLHDSGIEHTEPGVALLSAARNSIPPVRRMVPMVVVQTTGYRACGVNSE
jgi:hypothetical protein